MAVIRPRMIALSLLLGLGAAGPAAAWHEPARPVTDYSSATLNGGEWRIYITTLVEFGITDNLEIGTMPIVDLARIPNLQAKWNFVPLDDFGLAVSGGLFTTNPSYFNGNLPDVQIYYVPIGLFATWRAPSGDLALHGGLHYVTAGTSGDVSLGEALGFEGTARGSTLRFAPVLEWRRERSFAWVLEGSISLSQGAGAASRTTYTSEDGRTTVDVYADGAVADDGKVLGNVSVSAYWSWDVFNLRLGLVYGHAEIPMVGVLFDEVVILPEFNAYWRF